MDDPGLGDGAGHPGLSRTALERAWQAVHAAGAEDRELSDSLRRFNERRDERLDQLAAELGNGSWRPDRLTPVATAKGDGSIRELQVPTEPANREGASSA